MNTEEGERDEEDGICLTSISGHRGEEKQRWIEDSSKAHYHLSVCTSVCVKDDNKNVYFSGCLQNACSVCIFH